jgi:hypothetical protein
VKYCSPEEIKNNEACGTYGGESAYRVLVGKPEGKRPCERPRRRWDLHIKIDFKEIWSGGG